MHLRSHTRLPGRHVRWPMLLTAAVIATTSLTSCNDYPVHRLLDSFEVRVTDRLSYDQPVKLDFLWVIDQSASMCQEQRALSAAFAQFTKKLTSLGAIDAQMAVVTAQQAPDKTAIKVIGRFMHTPAKAFPPNCMERVRMHCSVDPQTGVDNCNTSHKFTFQKSTDSSMCKSKTITVPPPKVDSKGKAKGKWRCEAPSQFAHVSNLNCSLNSYCQSRCSPSQKNKDCETLFGKGAVCKVPGGGNNTDQAGCMFPPDTANCPSADKLPSIVKQADLDKYFKCNATVGAAQTPESKFEGGFRSAWVALDPKGPNCDYDACVKHLRRCCVGNQAWCKTDYNKSKCEKERKELCEPLKDKKNCQPKSLVRDGAYLILVFISDDDDCSMKIGLNPLDKKTITKEVWEHCQIYGDALGGNVALNEGNCEFKRQKAELVGKDVWCPSDCKPGSTAKTSKGLLKCPKGCKSVCDTVCAADALTKSKADIEKMVKSDWGLCPRHCRSDSKERAACMQKAFEYLETYTKKDKRFAPVDEFVTMFKSLKADPAQVIVAAITGDVARKDSNGKALNISERQIHRDRVNFYRSQLKDQGPGQAPYVCAGGRGESNYGSRYIELVQAFRDNGSFYNVCEGSDFGPALTGIADTILKRVTKICLPQPPYNDAKGKPIIKVTRKRGGQPTILPYNDGCDPNNPDSFCIRPSPDCRAGKADLVGKNTKCNANRDCTRGLTCIDGLCQVYNDAVFFPVVLDPGDEIEINYETDHGL